MSISCGSSFVSPQMGFAHVHFETGFNAQGESAVIRVLESRRFKFKLIRQRIDQESSGSQRDDLGSKFRFLNRAIIQRRAKPGASSDSCKRVIRIFDYPDKETGLVRLKEATVDDEHFRVLL